MQGRNNVLRVNAVEEQASYLEAVAEILREIQSDHKVTLLQISEAIDVSLGTVSNAANKKGVLNPLYLKRLGEAFGVHHLDPYAKLAGGRMVPLDPDGSGDILPGLMLVGGQIAQSRTPTSPGGAVETLREQLNYLPYLRRHLREIEALIHSIEARKDAA